MQSKAQSRRSFLKKTGTGIGGIIAASMFPAVVPSSVLGRTAPSNRINIGQIDSVELLDPMTYPKY